MGGVPRRAGTSHVQLRPPVCARPPCVTSSSEGPRKKLLAGRGRVSKRPLRTADPRPGRRAWSPRQMPCWGLWAVPEQGRERARRPVGTASRSCSGRLPARPAGAQLFAQQRSRRVLFGRAVKLCPNVSCGRLGLAVCARARQPQSQPRSPGMRLSVTGLQAAWTDRRLPSNRHRGSLEPAGAGAHSPVPCWARRTLCPSAAWAPRPARSQPL